MAGEQGQGIIAQDHAVDQGAAQHAHGSRCIHEGLYAALVLLLFQHGEDLDMELGSQVAPLRPRVRTLIG